MPVSGRIPESGMCLYYFWVLLCNNIMFYLVQLNKLSFRRYKSKIGGMCVIIMFSSVFRWFHCKSLLVIDTPCKNIIVRYKKKKKIGHYRRVETHRNYTYLTFCQLGTLLFCPFSRARFICTWSFFVFSCAGTRWRGQRRWPKTTSSCTSPTIRLARTYLACGRRTEWRPKTRSATGTKRRRTTITRKNPKFWNQVTVLTSGPGQVIRYH